MSYEVLFPQVGFSTTEDSIAEWLVRDGGESMTAIYFRSFMRGLTIEIEAAFRAVLFIQQGITQ